MLHYVSCTCASSFVHYITPHAHAHAHTHTGSNPAATGLGSDNITDIFQELVGPGNWWSMK